MSNQWRENIYIIYLIQFTCEFINISEKMEKREQEYNKEREREKKIEIIKSKKGRR